MILWLFFRVLVLVFFLFIVVFLEVEISCFMDIEGGVFGFEFGSDI